MIPCQMVTVCNHLTIIWLYLYLFSIQFSLFFQSDIFYQFVLFSYNIDLHIITFKIFDLISILNYQNLHFLQVLIIKV
jgi:hypothetical protein